MCLRNQSQVWRLSLGNLGTITSAVHPAVLCCCALQYSSAAPLTADARQRIVGEVFDLRRFVTVSMTVGPASGVLKDQPQEEWKPRDVALTVLIDRWGFRCLWVPFSGSGTAVGELGATGGDFHRQRREQKQGSLAFRHRTCGLCASSRC